MKTLIQSKKLNVFTLIVGLAALASSTELLAVVPPEWVPYMLAFGMFATALSGLFVDMTALTAPEGSDKPFYPPKGAQAPGSGEDE